jgi:aerobic-type carbon monoxide dehydrogenase small subunit (CoxS/CutS family)
VAPAPSWSMGGPKRSCVTRAENIAQKQITTIEGLARGEQLHPVQAAFLEEGALQCGYCTPGMIMSTVAEWTVCKVEVGQNIRTSLSQGDTQLTPSTWARSIAPQG